MYFPTLDYEKELWEQGCKIVCGLDEVGRGCFAGPVVVGAVVFSQGAKIPEGIADSKLLTPKKRESLSKQIKDAALYYSIADVGLPDINNFGIGKAAQKAFLEAINLIKTKMDHCLVDAFYVDGFDRQKQKPIVSGDKKCISIAAASIIAKVYRDELMKNLHEKYPEYGFDKHKGYGTKAHREAIKKYGLCPLHRTSFNLGKYL